LIFFTSIISEGSSNKRKLTNYSIDIACNKKINGMNEQTNPTTSSKSQKLYSKFNDCSDIDDLF